MLREDLRIRLGTHQDLVDRGLEELRDKSIVERIVSRDYTVWKREDTEITSRLGWLDSPAVMMKEIGRIEKDGEGLVEEGYTDAVILGMGGSVLAPEVIGRTMGFREGFLTLSILDSTDPAAVRSLAGRLDPAKTLFIVSSKSGTTVETLSFFNYFYNWISDAVGVQAAGRHFVAITDPGSLLADLARRCSFRSTYLNDPAVGGRYSALSYFGLVPAAFAGADARFFLNRSLSMERGCLKNHMSSPATDTCVLLGTTLGVLAASGRDKLTIITSPQIQGIVDWIEQLIAESTGKEGKGIFPVVHEPPGIPAVYGNDRVFLGIFLEWDHSWNSGMLTELEAQGHPVVYLFMRDLYDLGRQFLLWEIATAVAGYFLGINPFDQPDVEISKQKTRRMLDEFREKKTLPAETPDLVLDGISLFGTHSGETLADAMGEFLAQCQSGGYVALQAFVKPSPEVDRALADLRVRIRDRYRVATSAGYGPRYLHSTGQLHKGDAGRGLFIQITCEELLDVPIPDEAGSCRSSVTFGILKAAQAMGDRQALLDRGRKVIRLHFERDVAGGLRELTKAVS